MNLRDQHKAGLLTDEQWVEAKMRENQLHVPHVPKPQPAPLSRYMSDEERKQAALWLRTARRKMTRVIKMLEGDDSVCVDDIWIDARGMTAGLNPVPEVVERWSEDENRAEQAYVDAELVYRQTPEWEEKERERLRKIVSGSAVRSFRVDP